ncbi:MAG TPA: hypothetical protein VFV83_09280 [Chthoniobacteraceae bacterium]|nr:hypothetical protein [Chthoniobacteraceae bacterium]
MLAIDKVAVCGLLFVRRVKLLIFVGINVFGALGWWLGERYGLMTAFIASGIGSILGVYIGWLTARRLLE